MTLQLFCRRGESARFTTRQQQEAAITISNMASKERRRRAQAKNANHFSGCGESTIFTTREQ